MARLFFALWPPDAARDALGALSTSVAAAAGGRAIPPAKIHLTLAFLGEVPASREEAVRAAAESVRAAPLDLAFDRLGSFPRSQVAWTGPSRVPEALIDLAEQLAEGLRARGFALETRRFAAHVTLARRIRERVAPAATPPIAWKADAFALVESQTSTGRYVTRGSWALGTR